MHECQIGLAHTGVESDLAQLLLREGIALAITLQPEQSLHVGLQNSIGVV